MPLSKRLSVSSNRSIRSESPLVSPAAVPPADADEWLAAWQNVLARDLIDAPVVAVDALSTVEEACDLLLSRGLDCLTINKLPDSPTPGVPFLGLFDFSDVNAFLTLAATRHKLGTDELREKPRVREIVAAAKAGRVPVHLVSNLSEKNPLAILPHDASLIALLAVFARGTHRVLIQASPPSAEFLGIVSDRRLLSWFTSYAQQTPALLRFLANPLSAFALPSLSLYLAVVAARATDSVLHAMALMSEEGVSSIAVIEETGTLLSAVSVTDIGNIIVPEQSNQILSTQLHQFIARIKEPHGSTDGEDRFPVYSVTPSSTLFYTMQKLLATDAHRLFVTDDASFSALGASGSLSGIVSTVDVLSQFARLAHITDVDPTRMRHRRASSASSARSSSSRSSGSRSSSRLSESLRSSVSSMDSLQWERK